MWRATYWCYQFDYVNYGQSKLVYFIVVVSTIVYIGVVAMYFFCKSKKGGTLNYNGNNHCDMHWHLILE